MVCLGNICRSPLAHGILESKLSEHFIVDSAGTSALHAGELPDQRSISEAQSHGIDISNQRSRQFIAKDFSEFDVIYVMDQSNYDNVIALAKTDEDRAKVKLILSEDPNAQIDEVPDPYYGGADGFAYVFNLLDAACSKIATKLN